MEIPKNLEECFLVLDNIQIEDINLWLESDENTALSLSHHTMGQWIRNNWKLWEGGVLKDFFIEKGITHPDDMSSIILTSYHRRKNNKDIELNSQILEYKKYWENYKDD